MCLIYRWFRETENDDLTSVMQKIVCTYTEQLVPVAVDICQHLVGTFAQVMYVQEILSHFYIASDYTKIDQNGQPSYRDENPKFFSLDPDPLGQKINGSGSSPLPSYILKLLL